VRGLCAIATAESIDVTGLRAFCIGEPTADMARAAGFEVSAVASNADVVALARVAADTLGVALAPTGTR
jgi:uroporphyrinogen-III synthase